MNLQKNSTGRTIAGILLILFGTSIFLSNFNIGGNIFKIVFSWQVILIVVGIVFFNDHKNSSTGLILLMVGSISLIAKINHTSFRFILMEYWPVFLIIIGISLLFNRDSHKLFKQKNHFEKNSADVNSDSFNL